MDLSDEIPASSLLTESEASGLARRTDAVVDTEELGYLDLTQGRHAVLVPLPASFDEDRARVAPYGDKLEELIPDGPDDTAPHHLSGRDIDIILGSMGRSYLVDSTRDPRLTAATASSQLDMDYGHTVLDDGEPWAMLYDDQGRYATAPALDEL